jgi:hypothetical protein
MSENTISRLGAISGIAFVISVLVLNGVEDKTDLVLGAEAIALLLLVPFLVHLSSELRCGDESSRRLSTIVLSAGLVGLVVKFAGVLPAIIAERDELTPSLDAAFTRLGEVSFILWMPPLGLCLAAVAAAALRSDALPRSLGYAAAAIAPLLVVNGFDLGAEFGPAFILFLLWVLVTGVALLRRAVISEAPATGNLSAVGERREP